MPVTLRRIDSRTIRTWDGLALFWVVVWVVLGAWTGRTLWQAADAGDTISSSGKSLSSVGQTLQDVSALPLVPDRPGEIGTQVEANGDDITRRGQEVKGQLRQLGLLLGVAIVGIPVAPVLGFYLPVRLMRRRDVRTLRADVAKRPDDEGLDRYLAGHARLFLSYEDLVELAPSCVASPSGTTEDAGDLRRLADAELTRLGIARSSRG